MSCVTSHDGHVMSPHVLCHMMWCVMCTVICSVMSQEGVCHTHSLAYWQDCSLEIQAVGREEVLVRADVHVKGQPFPSNIDSEHIPQLEGKC